MAYAKVNKRKQRKSNKMVKRSTGSKIDRALGTAIKAAKLASMVYKVVNAEEKYHDHTLTAANLTDSGAVANLTAISQETTAASDTVREGDSIRPQRLEMRVRMTRSTTVGGAAACRLILFRYKNERGSVPTVTDILESASVVSPKKHDDRFESKVLFDKLFTMNPGLAGTGNMNKVFDLRFKLDGHVNYEGTNTIPNNGGLYLLYISDQSSAYPTILMTSRLIYTDN